MVTGTNTENRDHRFEVGELVVGGKEITADMLDAIPAKEEPKAEKLKSVELSGTYKNDHEAISEQLSAIADILRKNGLAK